MSDDAKQGRCNTGGAVLSGPIWFIGWLFTIAFVQLPWWKALIGLLLWPYFLGGALR
jgi:hypothetical protein